MHLIAFFFGLIVGLALGLILAFYLGSRAKPTKQETFDESCRRVLADMVKED